MADISISVGTLTLSITKYAPTVSGPIYEVFSGTYLTPSDRTASTPTATPAVTIVSSPVTYLTPSNRTASTPTATSATTIVRSPVTYLTPSDRSLYSAEKGAVFLVQPAAMQLTEQAVFSGNASTPTGALGFNAGDGDPYWNKVVLGLHFDGENNSTTFTDVKRHSVSVTAPVVQSTDAVKFGTTSGKFTSGYLIYAVGSDLDLTGDFTIELWLKPDASQNADCTIMSSWSSYINGAAYLISNNHYLRLGRNISGVATDYVNSTTTLPTDRFTHVVITRAASNVYMFFDGVLNATGSNSNPINFGTSSNSVVIGRNGWNSSSSWYNGYIDDLRITNGIARHTSNFAPPATAFLDGPSTAPTALVYQHSYVPVDTGALTLSTVNGDTLFNTVQMLMHMDNDLGDPYWSSVVAGFTFDGTNSSSPTEVHGLTVTNTGSTLLSTTQKKFGPSSCYFNGTSQSIALSDSTNLDLGSSDFTIECWFYPTSVPAADTYPGLVAHRQSASDISWSLFFNPGDTGELMFSVSTDGTTTTGTGSVLKNTNFTNKWNFVAITRSGSTISMYIDGQFQSSMTVSGSLYNSTTPLTIGRLSGANTTNNLFTGYIDQLRITKGVARYAGNFVKPTQGFTFSSQGEAARGLPVVNYWQAPVYGTTTKKFGAGAHYYDGVNDHFKVGNGLSSDINYGTSDFTIEAWVYPSSPTSTATIIGKDENNLINGDWHLNVNNANMLPSFSVYNSGWTNTGTATVALTNNAWNHVAVVRQGTLIKVYVNGALSCSGNTFPATIGSSNTYHCVGSIGTGSYTWKGYIDEVRISLTARYTADFSIPTAAFFDSSALPYVLVAADKFPDSGALALTGAAPAVFQQHVVEPATYEMTFASALPAAVQTHLSSPDTAAVILSGDTPASVEGLLVYPDSGGLIIEGQATLVSEGLNVLPDTGAAAVTGEELAILNGDMFAPFVGSLTFTRYAPTAIVSHIVFPATGSVSATGQSSSYLNTTVASTPTGELAVTGYAATNWYDLAVSPASGTLAFTGEGATTDRSNIISPNNGIITVYSSAPSVGRSYLLRPDTGSVGITGQEPIVRDLEAHTIEVYAQATAQFVGESVSLFKRAYINIDVPSREVFFTRYYPALAQETSFKLVARLFAPTLRVEAIVGYTATIDLNVPVVGYDGVGIGGAIGQLEATLKQPQSMLSALSSSEAELGGTLNTPVAQFYGSGYEGLVASMKAPVVNFNTPYIYTGSLTGSLTRVAASLGTESLADNNSFSGELVVRMKAPVVGTAAYAGAKGEMTLEIKTPRLATLAIPGSLMTLNAVIIAPRAEFGNLPSTSATLTASFRKGAVRARFVGGKK